MAAPWEGGRQQTLLCLSTSAGAGPECRFDPRVMFPVIMKMTAACEPPTMMKHPEMQAWVGEVPSVILSKLPDSWIFVFFAVPQHFVCPTKLCHGESGKHPPIQSVAPADADLRGATVLQPPHPAGCHRLFCANSSWTARKHDFEKGSHSEILRCSWTVCSILKAVFVVQNSLMFSSILFCLQKRRKNQK